jgi:hypothetical protein
MFELCGVLMPLGHHSDLTGFERFRLPYHIKEVMFYTARRRKAFTFTLQSTSVTLHHPITNVPRNSLNKSVIEWLSPTEAQFIGQELAQNNFQNHSAIVTCPTTVSTGY